MEPINFTIPNKDSNPSIIECNRILLTPFMGNLGDDSMVISWKSLGYSAAEVSYTAGGYMPNPHLTTRAFAEKKTDYSVFPNNESFAVRFPPKSLFTNKEGNEFVNDMLTKSNFASARRITHIIYRNENKPCGVVTREF